MIVLCGFELKHTFVDLCDNHYGHSQHLDLLTTSEPGHTRQGAGTTNVQTETILHTALSELTTHHSL